jgi:hypothetical protein
MRTGRSEAQRLIEYKPDSDLGLTLFGHSPYHWDVEALKDYTPWRENEPALPRLEGDQLEDIPF